jgi:ATP-dependent Clp protease ATP-binding subunit ClpA
VNIVPLEQQLVTDADAAGIPVKRVCEQALIAALRWSTDLHTSNPEAPSPTLLAVGRMTPRLGVVLRLAEAAAYREGTSVSTALLLSALIDEGGNLAVAVLRAAEVDLDALRAELSQTALREDEPVNAAVTAEARAALDAARAEAGALGHAYTGSEHLLLGLVAETSGVAGIRLRRRGLDSVLGRRLVVAAVSGAAHARVAAAELIDCDAAGPTISLRALVRQLEGIVMELEQRRQSL